MTPQIYIYLALGVLITIFFLIAKYKLQGGHIDPEDLFVSPIFVALWPMLLLMVLVAWGVNPKKWEQRGKEHAILTDSSVTK